MYKLAESRCQLLSLYSDIDQMVHNLLIKQVRQIQGQGNLIILKVQILIKKDLQAILKVL